jgi:hypothetical protein
LGRGGGRTASWLRVRPLFWGRHAAFSSC